MFAQLVTVAVLAGAALAQQTAYGQCGGANWTGATTCVSGFTCVYSNPYYSQCVPGTGSSTTTTSTSSSSHSTTTTSSTSTSSSPASTCTTIDTSQHCGQWDTVTSTPYTMYLDQWGTSGATGSDCATISSLCGSTIKWSTTWSWSGGSGVKTFTNINVNTGLNKQLTAVKSIQSTWNWTQTTTGTIVADIAYDLFTSATSGGSNAYEIMVWLANYNAGPISYTYGSTGAPTPVASSVTIAGHTWNVYYGSNGSNYVYSFLPTSGVISSFSADINLFLKYLTANQTLPSSQYLTTVQAGTEATSGGATLTSTYSAVIS